MGSAASCLNLTNMKIPDQMKSIPDQFKNIPDQIKHMQIVQDIFVPIPQEVLDDKDSISSEYKPLSTRVGSVLVGEEVLYRDNIISGNIGNADYGEADMSINTSGYRWRKTKIIKHYIASHQYCFQLEYVTWSGLSASNHDHESNVNNFIELRQSEIFSKIIPLGILTPLEIDRGIELNESHKKLILKFLEHGKLSSEDIEEYNNTVVHHNVHNLVEEVIKKSRQHDDISYDSDENDLEGSIEQLQSFGSIDFPYKVGDKIDVETYIIDEQTQERSYKWRKAIIQERLGNVIKVHFIGLANNRDEEIDLNKERHRIEDYNTKTSMERRFSDGLVRKNSIDNNNSYHTFTERDLSENSNDSKGSLTRARSELYYKHHHFDAIEENKPMAKSFNYIRFNKSNFDNSMEDFKANCDSDYSSVNSSAMDLLGSSRSANNEQNINIISNSKPFSKNMHHNSSGEFRENRRTSYPAPTPNRNTAYIPPSYLTRNNLAMDNQTFIRLMKEHNFHVIHVEGDGNCLFRAVSHQIYGDENHHSDIRKKCVEHMKIHRKRYEMFCDIPYDQYLEKLGREGTWGDDLEIKALEEIFDRIILIYSESKPIIGYPKPLNTNFDEQKLLYNITPIVLSYHGKCHYNSIVKECSEEDSNNISKFGSFYRFNRNSYGNIDMNNDHNDNEIIGPTTPPLGERNTKILLSARCKLFDSTGA